MGRGVLHCLKSSIPELSPSIQFYSRNLTLNQVILTTGILFSFKPVSVRVHVPFQVHFCVLLLSMEVRFLSSESYFNLDDWGTRTLRLEVLVLFYVKIRTSVGQTP